MRPDSLGPLGPPTHGTISGYKYHFCRCSPCRAASVRYEKGRRWLILQGIMPTLPVHGFKRRVRALMAIGWTQKSIAEALNIAPGNLALKLRSNATVRRATHLAMSELYERGCMTVRNDMLGRRTARIAARNGWPPPLAWDDIDDITEQPRKGTDHRRKTDVDHGNVERAMAGDKIRLTKAERFEVVRRMRAQGWSLVRIEKHIGITKCERYVEREAVA